jgi:galactokinase
VFKSSDCHSFCSSASVEIAVAVALAKIYNWTDYNLSHATTKEHEFQVRMKLVQLCQKARIGFVGAPSGVDHAFSVFSEEGRVVRLICSVSPIAVSFCDVGNEGCANLKLNMWVFASGYCHELADSLYKTRIQECKAAAAFLGVQSLSDCSLNHLESSRLALTEAQYSRAKHVIEETHRVHNCVEVLNPLCAQKSRTLTAFVSCFSICVAAT